MGLQITWIGQGGFLLDILPDNRRIALDPYLSDSVFREFGHKRLIPIPILPKEVLADFVVCTHDHLDHLDEETLRGISFDRTKFAGPTSCFSHFMAMGISSEKCVCLNRGDTILLGSTRVHGVFAAHTDDSIGVVAETEGCTVYFVGDSEYDPCLIEAAKWQPDVLVVCINGKYGNMDYKSAALLAAKLGVGTAIPCHYGMFAENTQDPDVFRRELKETAPQILYKELEFNVPEWLG